MVFGLAHPKTFCGESARKNNTFGSEQLHVQLTDFLEVEPLVTELGRYHKRVLAAHAATSKF